MREIKFRAWNEKRKEMGYFGQDENYSFVITNDGVDNGIVIKYNKLSHIGDDGYDIVSYPLNCLNLMQYTGIKDKNGKEIYDGDIIKPNFYYKECLVYKVVFEAGAFVMTRDNEFRTKAGFFCTTSGGVLEGEVIGNIYENPELIEAVK